MIIGNHDTDDRVFIVAELSCNHLGSLSRAELMIRTAARVGADAVKLQLDDPDNGITIDCDRPEFVIPHGPWKGRTYHDLYTETHTPWYWVPFLQRQARISGVELFSSVTCKRGVDWCVMHNLPAIKIGSQEMTDYPLLEYVAQTGKPRIVSDGCIDELEWGEELVEILDQGDGKTALLLCVSQYPATPKMFWMPRETFYSYDGISDHSLGNEISIAAVALGARIVERHFTLERSAGGPDSGFSVEPAEFGAMSAAIRNVEAAMKGKPMSPDRTFCKSLFAITDIKQGATFTEDNVRAIRPFAGLHPKYYQDILGKIASRDIERGEPMQWEMIE